MVRRRRQQQRRPGPINTLPNEVLLDVVRHLRVNEVIGRLMTIESARDLASVAGTCRRFYQLAMPTLWREVDLWPSYRQWPRYLTAYPDTASKRVLSYVRTVKLSVFVDPNYPAIDDFSELFRFMSLCLRMLKNTGAIETLYITVGLYDPNKYPSECNGIVEAINRIALQILKRIGKMKLRELEFNAGPETARIADIMSIIGMNVDKLDINRSPIAEWAPRLQYFKRLQKLQITRNQPRNVQAETVFWTTVSRLPNLKRVQVETTPIPPGLELPFPNLVELDMFIHVDLDYGEWSQTIVTVFKQISGLERLTFAVATPTRDSVTRLEGRAMVITTVACTNLQDLILSCPIPKGLISTIARHCPLLRKCYIAEDENVDDDDLCQLSRSCPRLREISLKYATTITSLEYFGAFHQLEVLNLFYLTGKFIDKPLLLKLVDSCPKLKQIRVSDWPTSSQGSPPKDFEDTAPNDLFAAAAELPSYFEPKIGKGWTRDGLDEYNVRIDKLREDISQFDQVTKRFGPRLALDLLNEQLQKLTAI